jgi:chromosome segregation ATPase
MERGHDYAKERSPRPKRLDTYEYKTHKERIEREIKEAVLATQKDLKAKIAQLREQLKEQGATRSQYAAIEQLNKELKEQIKANNLTIDQLKERFEAEKRAATELAREMGIVKPTDLKNYTAKSLLPEIQKKFNAKIENLEAENKAIRAENKALRDEIEEKSKDLERIEFLYGQVDGMLEAGATSEELKELSRVHEPYKPKQRAAYQTAKERALAAYRDRIRPTKTTAPQTTDEPILKTQYQTAGDDDEPIFGMTQNKIRGRAEDETIFKNR